MLIEIKLISRMAILIFAVVVGGCLQTPEQAGPTGQTGPTETASTAEIDAARSVWAVDLIRTLPGQQEEYLRNIEQNWAQGRRILHGEGGVRSYYALADSPDSLQEWDVLLMTEYPDSAAYEAREATFEEVFASPEYVRVPPARPSAELRTFVGNAAMRAIVSVPPR